MFPRLRDHTFAAKKIKLNGNLRANVIFDTTLGYSPGTIIACVERHLGAPQIILRVVGDTLVIEPEQAPSQGSIKIHNTGDAIVTNGGVAVSGVSYGEYTSVDDVNSNNVMRGIFTIVAYDKAKVTITLRVSPDTPYTVISSR